MNKTTPYIIVGIQKCGTTSLEKWMKINKYNCMRQETLINFGKVGGYGGENYPVGYIGMNGVEFFKEYRNGHTPIIILREPIKRIFSHYHYKQNHQRSDFYVIKEKNLKDALNNHPELITTSDYNTILEEWKELEPVILHFEDIIKWKDFPWETQCDCNIKMSVEDEKLIRSYINYKLHDRYL